MDSDEEADLSAHTGDEEPTEKLTIRRRHFKKKITMVYLLRNICISQDKCLEWLKDKGFIPKIMFCTACQRKMKFEINEHALDGYVWICKECPDGQSQLSARHGSWLDSRDASLFDVLVFTYWWAYGASPEQIARELNLPLDTVKEWNVVYLNICASVYKNKEGPDDDFASENALEKMMSNALMWRRKNKRKDLFIEFLKMADSL